MPALLILSKVKLLTRNQWETGDGGGELGQRKSVGVWRVIASPNLPTTISGVYFSSAAFTTLHLYLPEEY